MRGIRGGKDPLAGPSQYEVLTAQYLSAASLPLAARLNKTSYPYLEDRSGRTSPTSTQQSWTNRPCQSGLAPVSGAPCAGEK